MIDNPMPRGALANPERAVALSEKIAAVEQRLAAVETELRELARQHAEAMYGYTPGDVLVRTFNRRRYHTTPAVIVAERWMFTGYGASGAPHWRLIKKNGEPSEITTSGRPRSWNGGTYALEVKPCTT